MNMEQWIGTIINLFLLLCKIKHPNILG